MKSSNSDCLSRSVLKNTILTVAVLLNLFGSDAASQNSFGPIGGDPKDVDFGLFLLDTDVETFVSVSTYERIISEGIRILRENGFRVHETWSGAGSVCGLLPCVRVSISGTRFSDTTTMLMWEIARTEYVARAADIDKFLEGRAEEATLTCPGFLGHLVKS